MQLTTRDTLIDGGNGKEACLPVGLVDELGHDSDTIDLICLMLFPFCNKGRIVIPEIILANCMDSTELNSIAIHRDQLNPEHHRSAM